MESIYVNKKKRPLLLLHLMGSWEAGPAIASHCINALLF